MLTILLADEDEVYCKKLSIYILNKKEHIELITITKKEYLPLIFNAKSDVLVITPQMASYVNDLRQVCADKTVLLLQKETSIGDMFFSNINKFQGVDSFFKEICLKHAERTGEKKLIIKDSKKATFISVYSPCGGSGKTTLSLALSCLMAQKKNIFYLNLDQFASANRYFGTDETGGFSAVLLQMKQNQSQTIFGVQKNLKKHKETGVTYFNDLENPYNLEEISVEELDILIDALLECGDIDCIIADLDTGIHNRTRRILERSNLVFIPVLDNATCLDKMLKFVQEAKASKGIQEAIDKSKLIINRNNAGHSTYFSNITIGMDKPIYIPEFAKELSLMDVNKINRLVCGYIHEAVLEDAFLGGYKSE